jgi:hypothetical protein
MFGQSASTHAVAPARPYLPRHVLKHAGMFENEHLLREAFANAAPSAI